MGFAQIPRGGQGDRQEQHHHRWAWTEVCVTWPTLSMLTEGYNIYIVEDACGATSLLAHEAAIRRCVQAGAVPMTTIATVLSSSATGRGVSTTTP